MGFSVNNLPAFSTDFINAGTPFDFSGYYQQHLRRLLRREQFRTRKIGQN
jgi:hypothetical protein